MPRIELTCDTDFFVDINNGDDWASGTTSSQAKKTTQGLIDEWMRKYDFCGSVPTGLHAPGGYGSFNVRGRFVGQSQPPRIKGSTVHGACALNGPSTVWLDGAEIIVEGFTTNGGFASQFHSALYYRDIDFAAPFGHHIQTMKQGSSFYLSKRDDGTGSRYIISSGALDHIYVNGNSVAYLTETVNNAAGIEFINNPKFDVGFVNAIQHGDFVGHTNAWDPAKIQPTSVAAYSRWNSAVANVVSIPGLQPTPTTKSTYCDSTSTLV
jgi:hypothetical protein